MTKKEAGLLPLGIKIIRRNWQRVLFFTVCIAIGIGFLFSVGNLLDTIGNKINDNARELLAADAEVSSFRNFTKEEEGIFNNLLNRDYRATKTVWFASMITAQDKAPFLASIKAIENSFPFYGQLKVEPENYRSKFFQQNSCLIAHSISVRHGLQIGEVLNLGQAQLTIVGIIKKEPGRVLSVSGFAPRIMIPISVVAKTKLVQFGSRIRYSYLFAVPPSSNSTDAVIELEQELKTQIITPQVRITSFRNTQDSIREILKRQSLFFLLVAIVTLVVGAVGMASSFTTFLNEQLETVGTLRCMGIGPKGIFQLYLGVCAFIGIMAGILGCILGIFLSTYALAVIKDLLKFNIDITFALHWKYLLESMLIAISLTIGVNFYKISSLSQISPMEIVRGTVSQISISNRISATTVLFSILALFGYTFYKSGDAWLAFLFTAQIFVVVIVIIIIIHILLWLAHIFQKFLTSGQPLVFICRNGIREFVRARSRSFVFLLSLTIGFSLIGALQLVYHNIVKDIETVQTADSANIFLVDIRKSQKQQIEKLAQPFTAQRIDFAPLVRARLTKINDSKIKRQDIKELSDEQRRVYKWRTREYNLTYKDILNNSEEIIAGKFWQPGNTSFEISIERDFGKRAQISLGDYLTFDIQGRTIVGKVTSIRKIDWVTMKPNFFVIMPTSTIEKVPQTIVGSLYIAEDLQITNLQTKLAKVFPNIFVINISQVIENIQKLIGYFLKALQITALFCVAVGLVILIGVFTIAHRERFERVALLRTLGCKGHTIIAIDIVEFFCIGALSAVISGIMACALGFIMTRLMDMDFYLYQDFVWHLVIVAIIPIFVGVIVNWDIYRAQVMENFRRP